MLTYASLADNDPLPSCDRALCGWRVASALPLPDLIPWTGDDRAPDLTIDVGAAPERLPDLTVDRPLLQVAGDGTCRFAMPGVAVYLIDPAGTRVTIDPALPLDASDIRVFLLGTVFAVLCYRRGLLPLHASCVRIGNAAVALAGQSGVGKSTLAALFIRRGHQVLADDVTVVDAAAPGGPRVLPAFPRLKLWDDAIKKIDIPTDRLERTRPGLEKFSVPITESYCLEPLPLAAVMHLDDREPGAPRRLRGAAAVERLRLDTYRRGLATRLGAPASILPAMLRVAQIPGGDWVVPHRRDGEEEDEAISKILRLSAV